MNGLTGARTRARTKDVGRDKLLKIGIKPLAVSADEAAAVCGMSQNQFLKEVAARRLPPPLDRLLSKRKLWSLKALERAINGDAPAANDDHLMREIKSRATRAA